MFYSNLTASSSNLLAIENNRNISSRLAITGPDVHLSNPVVNESNKSHKSQSIISREEQSTTNEPSQAPYTSQTSDVDEDLSQRTVSQLNIKEKQTSEDSESTNDEEQPRTASDVDDFNMIQFVDYTDVTPKSPPSKSSLKRKLIYDDEDESESRNNSVGSVPEKKSKCDESSKKGTLNIMP